MGKDFLNMFIIPHLTHAHIYHALIIISKLFQHREGGCVRAISLLVTLRASALPMKYKEGFYISRSAGTLVAKFMKSMLIFPFAKG